VKGFVMDDERLASTRSLGTDYFDELLERIRRIRASGAPLLPEAHRRLREVQRRLRSALRHHEDVLRDRAEQDALGDPRPHRRRGRAGSRGRQQAYMGLTSWKAARAGRSARPTSRSRRTT
jgi:hypothetical protein